MSYTIKANIDQMQALRSKMAACKDKIASAGTKATDATGVVKNQCGSTVKTLHSSIKTTKSQTDSKMNKGISILDQAIKKIRENDYKTSTDVNKTPVVTIPVGNSSNSNNSNASVSPSNSAVKTTITTDRYDITKNAGVRAGAIRFLDQYNKGTYGKYFISNKSMDQGCGESCISMAMSAMGIDILPKETQTNNGTARPNNFSGSASYLTGKIPGLKYDHPNVGAMSASEVSNDLYSRVMKFKSDPEHNSPPIIYSNFGNNFSHYVVVTGYDANTGLFSIADSSGCNLKWLDIQNGNPNMKFQGSAPSNYRVTSGTYNGQKVSNIYKIQVNYINQFTR